jgi:hypothetical protein
MILGKVSFMIINLKDFRKCIDPLSEIAFISFLRNLPTAFHIGCTNFHSHQWCIRVPVLLHLGQHLLLLLPLDMAIQTEVRWNLSVVFICISFVVREVEHSFMIYWPFISFPLSIPCLIHLPISSWDVVFWELSFFSSL